MNILIVDDEYYIVQGSIKMVKQFALPIEEIYAAYSIEQAKKIIERKQIQILLTDIEMPQESGLDLVAWIRDNGYQIICLLLTGHQRFDYAHTAIMMHCFSYILKPVNKCSLEKEFIKAFQAVEKLESAASEKAIPLLEQENDGFVNKVRNYIQQNVGSAELNRRTISEYMHMNEDYLSTIFHNKFGCTLNTYITNTRIDYAKELLRHTSLSSNEISGKAGFSNSSYFHKQFKKKTGQTPLEFREGGMLH